MRSTLYISALGRRMGVPAVRRTGGLVGSASSLALRQVPIRDVGHRRHHLPRQPSATDDLVPGHVVRHQPEEWHQCFGTTACFRLGQLQDRLAMLHKLRRAMVGPGRDQLQGVVEVDETYWGGEEAGARGRRTEQKALIIVAARRMGKALVESVCAAFPT